MAVVPNASVPVVALASVSAAMKPFTLPVNPGFAAPAVRVLASAV